ncbi:unnamed protein product, partial [marine sediment metagenome]
WKAIHDFDWDYNKAYDMMYNMGIPRSKLRIAPPTLSSAAIIDLKMGLKAWPRWFDKLAIRLPGVRSAAQYGKISVRPHRRLGETWQQAYQRECIDEAPAWIAERATLTKEAFLKNHTKHSTGDFPDIKGCSRCYMKSWRTLAYAVYMGDPLSLHVTGAIHLPYMEPEFFRAGAGTWGGTPSW